MTPPQSQPDSGFDAARWEAVGIDRDEGLGWWRHRFELTEALAWRRVGISSSIDAVRWRIAGIGPNSVADWVAAGIDAREAVAWTEFGFGATGAKANKRAGRTPVQAYGRKHASSGPGAQTTGLPDGIGLSSHRFVQAVRARRPRVMRSYMERHWFDDEAIAWALHDFDADDALAWKELGLTPVEAQRQQELGLNAIQTAVAWWRAGIPADEVAEWIGAGLTPKEAAQQRASGVTVERAAVLRSLRKEQ